jgi:sulfatase maturation enzyme AslB (radical SAM superfamily)
MISYYEIGNIKKTNIDQIIQGPALTSIRHSIQQEQWHNSCAVCKHSEELSGTSARTQMQTSESTLQAINQDSSLFHLEHLTVNWSNLCNLSCTYCNPETSTAWQTIKKIPISLIKNEHSDLMEFARAQGKNILGLTLGGGEPLLQKGLVEFLDCLDPTKYQFW